MAPTWLEVDQLAEQERVPSMGKTEPNHQVPQLWLAEVVSLDDLLKRSFDISHINEREYHLALVTKPL